MCFTYCIKLQSCQNEIIKYMLNRTINLVIEIEDYNVFDHIIQQEGFVGEGLLTYFETLSFNSNPILVDAL